MKIEFSPAMALFLKRLAIVAVALLALKFVFGHVLILALVGGLLYVFRNRISEGTRTYFATVYSHLKAFVVKTWRG